MSLRDDDGPEADDAAELGRGAVSADYVEYDHDARREVRGGIIDEGLICINVNGQEFARTMCTPTRLNELALGFLASEGLIESLADVRQLHVTESGTCVDVWLHRDVELPGRPVITSGCGGGMTFDDLSRRRAPLASALRLAPNRVYALMQELARSATIYNRVRGIHTSGLADGAALLFVAEDVGRHNTIDRLWGQAMLSGTQTRDLVLLASGRISSEMISKAAKMGVPVIVSRTSPTDLSVRLARAWNVTLIGYCRGNRFRVYAGDARIGPL